MWYGSLWDPEPEVKQNVKSYVDEVRTNFFQWHCFLRFAVISGFLKQVADFNWYSYSNSDAQVGGSNTQAGRQMALYHVSPTSLPETNIGEAGHMEYGCENSPRRARLFWVFRMGHREKCMKTEIWWYNLNSIYVRSCKVQVTYLCCILFAIQHGLSRFCMSW